MSNIKTVRIPERLYKVIRRRARTEDVDESTAIRQLLSMGARNYAIDLYRDGKVTLKEASQLANVTVREMIDMLLDRGIKGNVSLVQQKKAIEFIRSTQTD
jgi:predicted HTH domain antitoxin